MGKLACDIVIGFISLSTILILVSIYLPWGSTSSQNPFGIVSARYYLLSIIVEPRAELNSKLTDLNYLTGNAMPCQSDANKTCYKFSTIEAFMSASAWEQFEQFLSSNSPVSGSINMMACFYGGIAVLFLLVASIIFLLMSAAYLYQYSYSESEKNRGNRKWRRVAQLFLGMAAILNFLALVIYQITLIVISRSVGPLSTMMMLKSYGIPSEGWILALFNLLVLLGLLSSYKTWRSVSAETAQQERKADKQFYKTYGIYPRKAPLGEEDFEEDGMHGDSTEDIENRLYGGRRLNANLNAIITADDRLEPYPNSKSSPVLTTRPSSTVGPTTSSYGRSSVSTRSTTTGRGVLTVSGRLDSSGRLESSTRLDSLGRDQTSYNNMGRRGYYNTSRCGGGHYASYPSAIGGIRRMSLNEGRGTPRHYQGNGTKKSMSLMPASSNSTMSDSLLDSLDSLDSLEDDTDSFLSSSSDIERTTTARRSLLNQLGTNNRIERKSMQRKSMQRNGWNTSIRGRNSIPQDATSDPRMSPLVERERSFNRTSDPRMSPLVIERKYHSVPKGLGNSKRDLSSTSSNSFVTEKVKSNFVNTGGSNEPTNSMSNSMAISYEPTNSMSKNNGGLKNGKIISASLPDSSYNTSGGKEGENRSPTRTGEMNVNNSTRMEKPKRQYVRAASTATGGGSVISFGPHKVSQVRL